MRRGSRTLTVMAATSVALSLAVGPVARAQDASPAPTPSPFCAVLTLAEVKAALGVDVTIASSSDTGCTYADPVTTSTTVDVSVVAGDYATVAPAMISDGTDVQVGGRHARVSTDGAQLYVDTAAGILGLLLTGPGGNAPTGIDAAAVIQSLGGLVVPRLASIPLPAQPTPTPAPSYVGDPDLVALFPTQVGGQPVQVESRDSAEMLASVDPTDEATQAVLQTLQTALATQGRSLADLSIAMSFLSGIYALRVKDADVSSLVGSMLPVFTSSMLRMNDPQQQMAQVAGKTVIVITEGPDSPGAQKLYAYPMDDVLWLVSVTDPALTEIFQKLP